MDADEIELKTIVKKDDFIKYVKNPCLSNWKQQMKNSVQKPICARCPFRSNALEFIAKNRSSFSEPQLEVFDQYMDHLSK